MTTLEMFKFWFIAKTAGIWIPVMIIAVIAAICLAIYFIGFVCSLFSGAKKEDAETQKQVKTNKSKWTDKGLVPLLVGLNILGSLSGWMQFGKAIGNGEWNTACLAFAVGFYGLALSGAILMLSEKTVVVEKQDE